MTVFVYVDTSKQAGDRDHLKVFAKADAAGLVRGKPSRRRGLRVQGDRYASLTGRYPIIFLCQTSNRSAV
jgi:hypothetical protein